MEGQQAVAAAGGDYNEANCGDFERRGSFNASAVPATFRRETLDLSSLHKELPAASRELQSFSSRGALAGGARTNSSTPKTPRDLAKVGILSAAPLDSPSYDHAEVQRWLEDEEEQDDCNGNWTNKEFSDSQLSRRSRSRTNLSDLQ